MEKLIIEDNYQNWFNKISDNYDENVLMSYNWKDIFKKIEHILKSPMSDFQIRVDVFIFLNRIAEMNFLKSDTEIKSYFNNLIKILIYYTTEANVRKNYIINKYLDNSPKIFYSFNKIIIRL